jgi:hypothetical protein
MPSLNIVHFSSSLNFEAAEEASFPRLRSRDVK